MSTDTPRTQKVIDDFADSLAIKPSIGKLIPLPNLGPIFDFARQLERELAAAQGEVKAYQDAFDAQPWATDEPARVLLNRITAELAALREDRDMLDSSRIMLITMGERVEHIGVDLRKAIRDAIGGCEYCESGIIRTLGRDNDELIEDCPHCSPAARKEAAP